MREGARGMSRAYTEFLHLLGRGGFARAAAMFEVRHETTVAAAHQLRFAPGEGERLHGHNWRIVAVLRCRELDARGMVVDFNDLARELRELVEPYEHVFLNEVRPYDDVNPTAANH